MPNHQRLRKWLGVLLATAVTALTATSALAVPPQSALAWANGYGTVTWEQVTPTPAEVAAGIKECYRFRVDNTQQPLANPAQYKPLRSLPPSGPVQGFGIKGLVIYHPFAPAMMSTPPRTNTTLYQRNQQYSWWDHNGSDDADGNGLQDRFTEPVETNTGSNSGYTDRENLYRLCYTQKIDPSKFVFGLHVVEPFSGNTFFAFGDQRPSLSLVKTVDTPCAQAGQTVTYRFEVKNTGSLTIDNIVVIDDKLGTIGTVPSLAPGASLTLSANTVLQQTTTNTAHAEGSAGPVTATADSGAVTVQVYHPGIDVSLSVSPAKACAGDEVTFTANVKNTGDVTLTGVVLQFSDNVNVSVGTLTPGQEAGPFNRVITIPANQTPGQDLELKVTAQGTATVCGGPANASDAAAAQVEIEPCATITGVARCAHNPDALAAGATVILLKAGAAVQVVTAGSDGKFTFSTPISDGDYAIRVITVDFEVYNSSPFTYAHDGSDLFLTAALEPLPINFRAFEQLSGRVFFSDVQAFRDREQVGVVLGPADLSNPLFASSNSSRSFRFVGTIPGFPGHYGGLNEPQVWVIIQEPLLSEDIWTGYSFTNLIAVEDGIGTGAGRPRSVYTVTTLFSQPFDGPGTAHNYTVTGLEVFSTPNDGSVPANPMPTWNSLANLIQIGPSPIAQPSPGDVPAGWMARTRFTYRFKPGQFVVYGNGSYNNACGMLFNYRLHPEGDSP